MVINKNKEIDLIDLFYYLRSRLWAIILSGIIFASALGLISNFMITPMFSSTSKIYILMKTSSGTSLADVQLGTQLTHDYLVLIESFPVISEVINNLELDMNYEELKEFISVTNPADTRILEIKAEYPNAYVAKQIVDEIAAVSINQIAKIMDTQEPSIVQEGIISTTPDTPNTWMNVIIGGVIGIVLTAGIFVVTYLLDDTVKTSEDIEKFLGLSTLGLIPVEEKKSKQVKIDKRQRKYQKVA